MKRIALRKESLGLPQVLKIISYLGLLLTIVPSLFVFRGVIDMKVHYNLMIVGMVLWFGTAPFYAKSSAPDEKEQ